MRKAVLILIAFAFTALAQKPVDTDPSETVIASFYLKSDRVDDFFKMMPAYWALLRKLDLVEAQPNLLLRGSDTYGKPMAYEVFTWKHGSGPDNAPPEVKAYWTRMADMVEKRDGHDGIEFPEVHIMPLEN